MPLHYHPISQKWFTLVELIVGMTIFAVWMTAILGLLHSTIDTAIMSRHEITASNILREQIELVKNTRNTNLRNYISWDSILLSGSISTTLTGWIFIIENDYTTSWVILSPGSSMINMSPVYMADRTSLISLSDTEESRFYKTRLYKDSENRFTHTETSTPTNYASYLIISPLSVPDADGVMLTPIKDTMPQWYILDARVITHSRMWYREYDLKTVITDWKK